MSTSEIGVVECTTVFALNLNDTSYKLEKYGGTEGIRKVSLKFS